MSTTSIYNHIRVNDWLSLGGQPTVEQIQSAAAEGFTTVINLGRLDPGYALEDEAGLVRSLGMDYHHIPVKWDAPTDEDFWAFDRLMHALTGGRTLLHCAANFRATAFYSLYALNHLGWTEQQAAEFRAPIWQGSDHPIWAAFIARITAAVLHRS